MNKIPFNGSFEQGWRNIVLGEEYGWLVNQEPKGWELKWLLPGSDLWDSADKVDGIPECVHKHAEQLPPHEQLGQPRALIREGEWVYKIFHHGASFGVELRAVVSNLEPGSDVLVRVPYMIKQHLNPDPWGAEFGLWVQGRGGWKNYEHFANNPHVWAGREQRREVSPEGEVTIQIRMKAKWPRIDFFLDDIQVWGTLANEPPPGPGPDPDPDPDPDLVNLEERIAKLESDWIQASARIDALTLRILALEEGLLDHTHLPEPNPDPDPPPPSEPERLHGVDVSHHQGDIDWSVMGDRVDFAFIRASYGMYLRDRKVGKNIEGALASKTPFGLYHFYRGAHTPHDQVDFFLSILNEYSGKWSIPPVIDLERDPNGDVPDPDINDVKLFLEVLSKRLPPDCPPPIIYTSNSYWNQMGRPEWGSDYDLWIAAWTTAVDPWVPNPWESWRFWQYAVEGVGHEYGAESRNLDLNYFDGGKAELDDYIYTWKSGVVDMLSYFRPNTTFDVGDIVTLEYHGNVTTDERQQLQIDGNRYYVTKNSNWELRSVHEDGNIYLDADTSYGDGKYYTSTGPWIPRFWHVGGVFYDSGAVTVSHISDCRTYASYGVPKGYREFVAHHDEYTIPESGLRFYDVVEIVWRNVTVAEDFGIDERYFYARGLGLIRWLKYDGQYSYAKELIPWHAQEKNERMVIPCLDV